MSTIDFLTVGLFVAGLVWILAVLLLYRREILFRASETIGKMRGLSESPDVYIAGNRMRFSHLAVSALGVLVIAAGIGYYYRYGAVDSTGVSGEVVANGTTGKPLRFTVRNQGELEQILADLKENAKTVDALRVHVEKVNLRDIGALTNLKSLDLDSTSVESLEALRNLGSLTALDLGKTGFMTSKSLGISRTWSGSI